MIKYRKILLIDDDEDDQLLFSDALNEIDPSLKYYMASNGIDALRKLEHYEVEPDIIFLDLNMPLMNGFEFLVEIRKFDRVHKIPIVIFSTSNSPEHALRTYELGASAFLTKPAGFGTLRTKLASVLRSNLLEVKRKFHISEYLV